MSVSVGPAAGLRSTLLRVSFWVLLAALAWGSSQARAATFHVRADGGDAAQCTGLADAPYAGSGSAQACAWKHPFIALPPGGPARIAGGDTLAIHAGSYMMGLGAPGAVLCHQAWSWDCFMTAVPSGASATQPTRIVGVGTPSPELWGTERTSIVLNLRGSSNVVVENLEITDHESCIDQHCHGGVCAGEINKCNRDAAPWGKWAGTGLSAMDSANVTLRDVNIHGMANRGVHAARLTDWTMERLKIRGNGWSGWDGDIVDDDTNHGVILFRELELSWNGCGERWPSGEPWGCWGQTAGGYGDGLGTGATAGHWIIEDSMIHHNTSDGLDLLYMKEGGRVTIRRTWAEGNAGNQLKTKGDSLIENSVIVGNCSYFDGQKNMFDGDHCRALGNALSIGLHPASVANLVNNTITGEGDCLVLSGGGGTGAQLNFSGNVLLGQVDWRQPWESSCAHYSDAGGERVAWTKNAVSGVKNAACPAGSLCVAPLLANASLAAFDAAPLAGSPLIDGADAVAAPRDDINGHARPVGAGPDIGAIEHGATAGAPVPPPPPVDTPTLVVQQVTVAAVRRGQQTQFTATVRVVDQAGKAVANASVTGQWSGGVSKAAAAVTDATGTARFDGGKQRGAATATFCVANVALAGHAYAGTPACASN